MNEDTRDRMFPWFAGVGGYIAWLVVVFAVVIVPIYIFQPMWLGIERDSFTKSHQYVESKKSEIISLVNTYRHLETDEAKFANDPQIVAGIRNQKAITVDMIRTAASGLRESEVPDFARPFLSYR